LALYVCHVIELKTKIKKDMETAAKTAITVEIDVNAPIEKVWKCWTEPKHITGWSFASDDWHAPSAENDVRKGGKFNTKMAAKDGSVGFDFAGVYTNVQPHKLIEYTIEDGRKVSVIFTTKGSLTHITETFEAESENLVEMQKGGWQMFLENFKKYTEKQ
jgi:uncharacterized protein YndB with AHSA1/START domain